ncbi:MAG: hypothetical protein M1816_000935 [Peltula sp. TS41687]|nr:MAG: hypothetical protein M1816_000935 [Peltula sp. TS41687]
MDQSQQGGSSNISTHRTDDAMRIAPTRATQLLENISTVTRRINAASNGRPVRLVAVSKLKPANDIRALHHGPTHQQHFGENYLQELLEKAELLPRSIHWHFIGALQTNKCKQLAQIPNLFVVSSVDAPKKADALNRAREQLLVATTITTTSSSAEQAQRGGEDDARLGVHVQVNTSGEESKSGVAPGPEAVELCRHVREKCPHLRLRGLMTIGAIARSQATTAEMENEDFVCLRDVRDRVVRELGIEEGGLELSMGMSEDFEGAIRLGSDEVRVGSTIFGQRPARKDAKVMEDVEEGHS